MLPLSPFLTATRRKRQSISWCSTQGGAAGSNQISLVRATSYKGQHGGLSRISRAANTEDAWRQSVWRAAQAAGGTGGNRRPAANPQGSRTGICILSVLIHKEPRSNHLACLSPTRGSVSYLWHASHAEHTGILISGCLSFQGTHSDIIISGARTKTRRRRNHNIWRALKHKGRQHSPAINIWRASKPESLAVTSVLSVPLSYRSARTAQS
ncbi:hypothetical protein AVEN_226512-1 [Araneus ventricosus]|uniref:Uncharacterized protein n=1 Tax=Araneus ventricosus TaxID=182803 RepID=A0A4Y2RVD7_ARAVE|nr:hypothetical protein AVEN_226512-1 [Araneus ventricosus]